MKNSQATKPDIAVLGLGIIGGTWARHLESDGRLAAAWNRTANPGFARWVADPAQAVEKANVVLMVLSDPGAVAGLLEKIEGRLRPDHLVIQSTTIDPASSGRFEARVGATGAAYLEAPFTGSKPAAEARKVVYYLGGEAATVERAESILAPLSDARLHIGTCAQAAALKLAMNLQIALQAGALCESLSLARGAGISDDVYFGALRKNAAWSGLTALKEPKLRACDFSPQFSVKHMLKDMRLLREMEGASHFSLARSIEALLAACDECGAGDEDFIAMIERIDRKPQS